MSDRDVELHVTLCHAMTVKVMGEPISFICFDGYHVATLEDPSIIEYRAVKIYLGDATPLTMKITLNIPAHNIAGFVVQPFGK